MNVYKFVPKPVHIVWAPKSNIAVNPAWRINAANGALIQFPSRPTHLPSLVEHRILVIIRARDDMFYQHYRNAGHSNRSIVQAALFYDIIDYNEVREIRNSYNGVPMSV